MLLCVKMKILTKTNLGGVPTDEMPVRFLYAILFLEISYLLGCFIPIHHWHDQIHENNIKHFAIFKVLLDHLSGLLPIKTSFKIDTNLR